VKYDHQNLIIGMDKHMINLPIT